nr:substrate-binding domain-containing protein [Bradyrhizobium sp. AS23.2]
MRHIRIAVAALILAANAAAADCAEVKVLSTPTMKSALDELAPAFTRATGHTLILTFEGVPVLKRQIEAGETFDAAVLLPAAVDDLAKLGKIAQALVRILPARPPASRPGRACRNLRSPLSRT